MITASIRPGIQLHILPEGKFNTIIASVLLRTPLERNTVTQHALLPGILKRGTKKYPNHQLLYEKAESLFGAILDTDIIKKGEEQILQGYIEVLKDPGGDRLEPLFWDGFQVLMDVLFNPCLEKGVFVSKYVDMEKKQLAEKIKARMNDKKEYALNRLIEKMCETEPFSLYGDGYLEDLDAIEPDGLYDTYRKLITESTIDIIIVGDVKQEPLLKILSQYIFTHKNIRPGQEKEVVSVGEIKKITESMHVSQGKLCLGMRAEQAVKGQDYYALMVLNSLLGGGSHGLLFQKLREKNSLCYYINSTLYRFKSILIIQSGIQPEQYDKAVALIQEAIEALKEGGFTDEDFNSAVQFLVKQYDGIGDYPSAIMDFYISNHMAEDASTIEQMKKAVSGVTREDVIKAAQGLQLDTVYFLKGGQEVERQSTANKQNS